MMTSSKDDIAKDIIRYIDVDDLLDADDDKTSDTTYNRIIVVPDEDELEAESKAKEMEERLKRREEERELFRQLKREEEEAAITGEASASGESGDQIDETIVVNEEAPSEQGIWAWRGKKEMGHMAPAWRGRRKDATGAHNKRASYFTRKMINWMNFNKANLARKSGAKKSVKRGLGAARKDSQFLSLTHHTMGKDATTAARSQFLKLNPSGMGDSLRKEFSS